MNEQQTRTGLIERAIDKEVTAGLSVQGVGGGLTIKPQNMTEVMEFAKMMSTGGAVIRSAFRGNPGACLAITMQSLRWGMDPFAVANKAYLVKGKDGEESMSYEAQLVQAVITERAPLQKRLRTAYDGEGPTRKCIVTGYLKDEDEPFIYESPELRNIGVTNSPLWKSDPDQQLSYYSVRSWARRHVPEVLLGVYTPDEIEAQAGHQGPNHAKIVGGDRPKRSDYENGKGEVAEGQGQEDTAVETDPTGEGPMTYDMIGPFGEDDGSLHAEPFIAWFFGSLTEIPEDVVCNHIRNNIETALECVAATTKDSRAFYTRLSGEGWPPESYQEKANVDEPEKRGSADDVPPIPDELRRGDDHADDEPSLAAVFTDGFLPKIVQCNSEQEIATLKKQNEEDLKNIAVNYPDESARIAEAMADKRATFTAEQSA